MADIVKDTYDRSKGQQAVIFQQKKPLLNYELNLAQEITNRKIEETDSLNILTNYNGDSFKIYPSASNHKVMVTEGVFYHEGQPLHLTVDKEVDMSQSRHTGTYTIYAEWYIDEVDGEIDGSIGFVTSRERRLVYDVAVSELNSLPVATPETITFLESNSSISLQTGHFPNWLRIEGTKFTTNSINNPGQYGSKNYFEVVSSPNDQTLIVSGSSEVEDEFNLANVEFYQYTIASNVVANKFKAYRRNILPLAEVARTFEVPLIDSSSITDLRECSVYNFLAKGAGEVTDPNPGGFILNIGSGEVWVGDKSYFIEEGTSLDMSLTTSTLNYIYVESSSGYVESSDVEPVDFHVMLAEVQVVPSEGIPNINDKRKYRPFAWDNKYGQGGGTGETGKESISVQYTASDDLNVGSAVGLTGDRTVGKASALSAATLPAIGLSAQNFVAGQKDNVVVYGEISNLSWSWEVGENVFLDTSSGGLTQTPTQTDGQFVQRIGVATEPTTVFVKPDLVYTKQQDIFDNETRLLSLREDGTLEVIGKDVKIQTDRSSFLASIEEPNTTSFKVLPGRYYINETESVDLDSETLVDLSTTVAANVPASGQINKIFFTISVDNLGNPEIKGYEGLPDFDIDLVEDPIIPENEMPLSVVDFEYSALGTPLFISKENITDKRVWLNLGSLDSTSFRPVYRSDNTFVVQKGEAWFNNVYVSLPNNLEITGDLTTVGATYFIYLDTQELSGTEWFKTTPLSNPEIAIRTTTMGLSLVDRRRYIPLGAYTVQNIGGSNVINRSSFVGFKAKFLQYRDAPFTDVYTEEITSTTVRDTFDVSSSFTFINEDYLDIDINGVRYYKDEDYQIYEPNTVAFSFNVRAGSKVKIKKV